MVVPASVQASVLVPNDGCMSVPALTRTVSEQEWLEEAARRDELVEIVDGKFVVKRVGGNPHHYLARRLAEEFERQRPGVTATCPGQWALAGGPDGIAVGRLPDVLVDGDALLREAVFYGVPDAAVEVWSPSNTLAEMNAKRREYREGGLPVFVEVFLNEAGDVHVEWLVNDGSQWVSAAVAAAETELVVDAPRPFHLVPNALLRRP